MPAQRTRAIALYLLEFLGLLLLVGLALWLRWPALSTEGFHNEDAAGIAYNADLLRRGLLPMIDNLELKAPGSFYLSWISWELFGRSIVTLQRVACFWAILGALGIYAGGRMLYGRASAILAALLFTLAAPITDSIDINYGAWMSAPYIWTTVFFIAGLRTGKAGWLGASGFTLALAGVLKRQAAVLFPLFGLLILLAPLLARPEGWRAPPRKRALLYFGIGLALGFAPLMAYYLAHGELWGFVEHYFFSKGGWRYVKGELSWAEKLPRIGDGFLGFWEYMAVPSLLMVIAAFMSYRPKERLPLIGILLGGHFWLSFAGAALGFRFFKGYYLQTLPAAVWIAAHPRGPLTRWFDREIWRGTARKRAGVIIALICLLGALTPAIINDTKQVQSIRKRRAHSRDSEAQRAARVIRPNTEPGDTIWVWGRWAWPVYFHADRLAATPYYKVLGVITTNLTNTWRRATKRTTFTPQGPWRELIDQLEEGKPKFIVVSKNEDYSKFKAFKGLLRKQYKRVPHLTMRNFVVYQHKTHTLKKPPKPHPGRRKKSAAAKRAAEARAKRAAAKAKRLKAASKSTSKPTQPTSKPAQPASKPTSEPARSEAT